MPFFIYFLFLENTFYKVMAFAIFLLASITDLIDGYLARKWKQETEFGKFLDPLADKILVIGAFVTFILLDEQIETWMVLLIILRDMLITSLRYIGIKQNKSIRTTRMGKIKTTFQMGAILLILLFFMVVRTGKTKEINNIFAEGRIQGKSGFQIANENYTRFARGEIVISQNQKYLEGLATFLPYYVMLATTIITVLSGIRYLYSNRELLSSESLRAILKNTKKV